ncbi:hypothetical protein EDD93_1409 [Streptomyces sp. 840.1]|uniref:hypothetical protein n=1 Tax=Streptomyces sp. 840.1 TaxID=2485152 RepID=UPI000F493937|nr:hypothetical protein [Streptomyces sp. 840.1]ROQ66991.1 hypothetical protein EDD93_1409 [Streptomyces sp. 840.1]
MAHHHKANRTVEGDPDHGHGRGMPRRPDEGEMRKRTARDQEEAGRSAEHTESPDEVYRAAQDEVDRQTESGEMPSAAGTRKDRDPFPPTSHGKQ